METSYEPHDTHEPQAFTRKTPVWKENRCYTRLLGGRCENKSGYCTEFLIQWGLLTFQGRVSCHPGCPLSSYVAKDNLYLPVLISQVLGHRHVPPCLVYAMLGPESSSMLGKQRRTSAPASNYFCKCDSRIMIIR